MLRQLQSRPSLIWGSVLVTNLVVTFLRVDIPRQPWTPDEDDLTSLAVGMRDRAARWIRPTDQPCQPNAHDQLGDDLVAPPLASALMSVPGLFGFRQAWAWPLLGALIFVIGVYMLTRAL